jgi:type IV secretion system protein VirB2
MKRLKHYWSCCINYKTRIQASFIVGLLSSPSVSFAQDLQGVINNTVTYLRGGTARAVGILCIIITGYLCLARQVFPKESFMMVLVGMGLIFGSASIYSTLIGM